MGKCWKMMENADFSQKISQEFMGFHGIYLADV
jgi:hypothetical protein